MSTNLTVSPKSRLVLTLLSFFVGAFGVDRMYAGSFLLGLVKLLIGSWITLGIWPLVDFILAIVGKMKDGQGRVISNW
ncbi:TM2 domain-containing protein [Mycoplasma simbae]|uniref:TM2 domain-containing protein n=1 Tax=Mycoplasma simbae TaxID=36744 RepID=UPI000495B3C9|nr:TM2 domain-containing protein [Mycoplasma simbae]